MLAVIHRAQVLTQAQPEGLAANMVCAAGASTSKATARYRFEIHRHCIYHCSHLLAEPLLDSLPQDLVS